MLLRKGRFILNTALLQAAILEDAETFDGTPIKRLCLRYHGRTIDFAGEPAVEVWERLLAMSDDLDVERPGLATEPSHPDEKYREFLAGGGRLSRIEWDALYREMLNLAHQVNPIHPNFAGRKIWDRIEQIRRLLGYA